jgi:hypothetical protein
LEGTLRQFFFDPGGYVTPMFFPFTPLAGDLLVALLFLANLINIGPDAAAMGQAAKLVLF